MIEETFALEERLIANKELKTHWLYNNKVSCDPKKSKLLGTIIKSRVTCKHCISRFEDYKEFVSLINRKKKKAEKDEQLRWARAFKKRNK